MKKLFLLALISTTFIACNQKSGSFDNNQNYKALFEKSMEIKDYHTAITALQMMLLSDSSVKIYEDTLPELYAAVQNYEACSHYTDIALKKYPGSEKYLQVKALCLQQAGRVEEEFDIYNKLYATTQKVQYLYQITAFEFSTGQMEKAEKDLAMLEQKARLSKDSVDFLISETEKQKIPVRAAVYNMKAYMQAQKRDLAGAKMYFEMALKEDPNFVMAKRNLMQLMQAGKQR